MLTRVVRGRGALMESLLTSKLVDEITDAHLRKSREACGQGVANVLSGIFGGMGGCAVIGQTMINVKASGARTCISTFCAGLLFLLVVVFGDATRLVPSKGGLNMIEIKHAGSGENPRDHHDQQAASRRACGPRIGFGQRPA